MRSAVLDTDVVSFLFKNETRGHLYRHLVMGIIPIISFMTLAELDLWALSRNWGVARQERMKHHLHSYMVLSVDRGLCEMWAVVSHQSKSKGLGLSCSDAWIAATALHLGVPLITHNSRHFKGIEGLQVMTHNSEI
jgi:tRNA(fMet)-specific endonuclease VapC